MFSLLLFNVVILQLLLLQPIITISSSVNSDSPSSSDVLHLQVPSDFNNESFSEIAESVSIPESPLSIGQLLNQAVTQIDQTFCDISLNCTEPNQLCMNGRCTCEPNYA